MSRSPHAHGRSGIWEKPGFTRLFDREMGALGERIRAVRTERGLSQDEAAERIGMHTYSLGKIERGKANPSFAVLLAIARAYKVDVADLLAQ